MPPISDRPRPSDRPHTTVRFYRAQAEQTRDRFLGCRAPRSPGPARASTLGSKAARNLGATHSRDRRNGHGIARTALRSMVSFSSHPFRASKSDHREFGRNRALRCLSALCRRHIPAGVSWFSSRPVLPVAKFAWSSHDSEANASLWATSLKAQHAKI
jgi:hypothetical protein